MKAFLELTGKEKSLELLRWLLVPVMAALVLAVPAFISRFVLPPMVAQLPGSPPIPGSDFRRYVLPWVFSILLGAIFVFAGAKPAPRFRFATAIVLAVLWISRGFLYYVWVHVRAGGDAHYTHFAATTLSAVAGAVCIFFAERLRLGGTAGLPSSGEALR